jgi:Domain of unknown function (DUF4476)
VKPHNVVKMNKFLLGFLFTASTLAASSQKVYFIYIQTEPEQPFFIKMNDKVQSSSASGYLILSKLLDTTYTFTVGFPQNKWPESKFSIPVNRKDHGYLLKNFGEKGWGLFDLQTLAIQMPVAGNIKMAVPSNAQNKDASLFTEILSKAADDPSLKNKTEQPKSEEKKMDAAKTEIIKKEEPIITTQVESPSKTAIEVVEKKEVPKVEAPEKLNVIEKEESKSWSQEYKTSTVKKRSESSTTEGFGLVFIDSYITGENDTIRLIIPNPKPAVQLAKDEIKEEKKVLDIPIQVNKVEDKAKESKVIEEPGLVKTNNKKECNEIATEADFFKLRKLMAAANSDDEMITEAKKDFKSKCFTTAQFKNLGALFLNDEGKYQFFDAAYNFVADPANFNSLQNELKEEYYINRFKAMLRN